MGIIGGKVLVERELGDTWRHMGMGLLGGKCSGTLMAQRVRGESQRKANRTPQILINRYLLQTAATHIHVEDPHRRKIQKTTSHT
jgi:hypothetical protein